MNEKEQYWEIRLERVKRALEANGMDALVADTGQAACRKVLEMIGTGASVGLGGSRTVEEIGLLEALRKGDYVLHDQYRQGLGRDESMDTRRRGTHAEFFVSGSNAITDDGRIVNTDGMGNRLAGFCFGPGRVIIVAGRNKIVPDLDAAFYRIRNVAAPMNARRFGVKTPCVKTGKCTDCDSPERICNLTLIIERQRMKGHMTVILVNEDLGF
jgi:L-lactate utilization protein LutB